MAPIQSTRFLSLIPTLHENAVIIDRPTTETEEQAAIRVQAEKVRRDSSSSESSVSIDVVSKVQSQQFLKLGQ